MPPKPRDENLTGVSPLRHPARRKRFYVRQRSVEAGLRMQVMSTEGLVLPGSRKGLEAMLTALIVRTFAPPPRTGLPEQRPMLELACRGGRPAFACRCPVAQCRSRWSVRFCMRHRPPGWTPTLSPPPRVEVDGLAVEARDGLEAAAAGR